MEDIADGRFAPGYFDNEFKLQKGFTNILGFNEPGELESLVFQNPDIQTIVIQL